MKIHERMKERKMEAQCTGFLLSSGGVGYWYNGSQSAQVNNTTHTVGTPYRSTPNGDVGENTTRPKKQQNR